MFNVMYFITLLRHLCLNFSCLQVAALVPKSELEGEMGDAHMALQARLMNQALRKLSHSLSLSQTILLFINQVGLIKVGYIFVANLIPSFIELLLGSVNHRYRDFFISQYFLDINLIYPLMCSFVVHPLTLRLFSWMKLELLTVQLMVSRSPVYACLN